MTRFFSVLVIFLLSSIQGWCHFLICTFTFFDGLLSKSSNEPLQELKFHNVIRVLVIIVSMNVKLHESSFEALIFSQCGAGKLGEC